MRGKTERLAEVRNSKCHGRGVFATQDIKRGTLIETCPVMVGAEHEIGSTFEGYPFEWKEGLVALAFGCGSFLNHSFNPNAYHHEFYDRDEMRLYARRDIRRGEEITINYLGHGDDPEELWFDVG